MSQDWFQQKGNVLAELGQKRPRENYLMMLKSGVRLQDWEQRLF